MPWWLAVMPRMMLPPADYNAELDTELVNLAHLVRDGTDQQPDRCRTQTAP